MVDLPFMRALFLRVSKGQKHKNVFLSLSLIADKNMFLSLSLIIVPRDKHRDKNMNRVFVRENVQRDKKRDKNIKTCF